MAKKRKDQPTSPVGAPQGRPKMTPGVLSRIIKMLFRFYPVLVPVTIVGIVFSAITATMPAIFLQRVISTIEDCVNHHEAVHGFADAWELVRTEGILGDVLLLGTFYVLSLIAVVIETQLAAIITQGFLGKLRKAMFDGMQNLPIRYFDTHKHGDIMSYYTNDIDALRMLIEQTLPTLIRAGVIVLSVFCIMLYYSLWLTAIVIVGVVIMILVSKKLGGGSAKFFIALQKNIARQEGYVQEMMNGQKVVKVFCHEQAAIDGFSEIKGKVPKGW